MAKSGDCSVFWFRRDLRLKDNHGLFQALKGPNPVIPIFIFDTNILDHLKEPKDKRVSFLHETISTLKKYLQSKGSDLVVYHGKPEEVWRKILSDFSVKNVYANHDIEPYPQKRDEKVSTLIKKHDIQFETFKDHLIFEKNEVVKSDGKPYLVYTPYKKSWLKKFKTQNLKKYPSERNLNKLLSIDLQKMISLKKMGFEKSSHGLNEPKLDLDIISDYDKTRDFPSIIGTTKLGTHLRFGTISIRKCVEIAQKSNDIWLSELIWREFFSQILWHFPHVVNQAFRSKYDKIKWVNDKKQFKKWCEGKTGIPIVDAGMRELNATGFMHNRVRMITASFLVKNLLIDWRWGEKYFAKKLLDFELASNNGNWQWVAGSGCDSAPYFRIFNPETQAKKFDPNGDYVKKWVPEFDSADYPDPMIDLKTSRKHTLIAYQKALKV